MSALLLTLLCVVLADERDRRPPRLEDALPAIRGERWEEAVAVLEPVVAASRYDGTAHYYLGISRQALGQHDAALEELDLAVSLGVNGRRNGMRMAQLALARSHAASGDPELALESLDTAHARWGFDDLASILTADDFELLHDDPRLRSLAGLDEASDGGDRDARWRADLGHLRRLIIAAHPEPFHTVGESTWNREADALAASIPHLTDLHISSELMRLVARIGDGHTALYPKIDGECAWHLLPFYPLCLADGWYVAAAAPGHEDLVGARLMEVNGKDWVQVLAFATARMAHDNEFTARWLAGIGLQFAELHALATGSDDASSVELTVLTADGRTLREQLDATPIDRDPNAGWPPESWNTAWEQPPLWLQEPFVPFLLETLEVDDVVYARLDQTRDFPSRSMADIGREIGALFEETGASGMILDLRRNNGGDANEARAFVDQLLRIPVLENPDTLLVLIGPRTFSATGYILGMLEKHREPTFIGWPSGCRPVFYSTERPFRLPYSGLTGSISNELRIDGFGTDDLRPAFFPHEVVWPTGEDLRQGRDPVLEAALRRLR